jgi:hypothetical protein
MKTPTEYDVEKLMHVYDPAKAHEYYMRVRQLKGRKKGSKDPFKPPTGKPRRKGDHKTAKAKQRKELAAAIQTLEAKLSKLEKLIQKKKHAEASENRKGKAKKERSAKAKDKPKSAAEKAAVNRENEKYRKKNQQKLKTKSKSGSGTSGGGSSKSKTKAKGSQQEVEKLTGLATKVRGQIQVAKQKLAAL